MTPGDHAAAPRRGLWAAAFVASAVLASPSIATGQDAKAAAEAIFEEGLAAFEAKDYATACPKLEAAVGLTKRESLGGLLLLAECQEARGRTATAWALYRECATKAARAGQSDREAKAREGEARLATRLYKVAIVVPDDQRGLGGLSVRRGNDPVPAEAFGTGLPADPGPLVVTAEAPGHAPFRAAIDVPSGPGESRVEVHLHPVPAGGSEPAPSRAPVREGAPEPARGTSAWRIGGLVVGGVGVAGMGVSTVLALVAKGDYDDASTACPGALCPTPSDKAAVDDARGLGDTATGVFFAGAGLLAVGSTIFLVDLLNGDDAPSATSAQLGVRPGRVELGVRFF